MFVDAFVRFPAVCVCVCVCVCMCVCVCVLCFPEIVQIRLWMIQHANNHSVVQCNVSPVILTSSGIGIYNTSLNPSKTEHGIEVLSDS